MIDAPGRANDAPPACEPTTLEATRAFLAVAVADAARDAVEVAFAEFRPVLLQAVASLAAGSPIDRSTGPGNRSPHPFNGHAMSISQEFPVLALHGQLSEEPQEQDTGATDTLPWERTKSRTYSQGRPTIESLQADLAMAVLDRSGYGPSIRRSNLPPQQHQRRYSGAGLKRSCSQESASFEEAARVVFETPLVPEPGSQVPGASADADGDLLPHVVACETPASMEGMSTSASACPAMSRSSHALSKHVTGSQALQTYFDELAQEATRDKSVDSIEEPELSRILIAAPVWTALCVMGMLRWHSERRPWLPLAYQWLARAGVVLAAVAFFLEALWGPGWPTSAGEGFLASCDADACWQHAGFISQLPLPVGALIALLPIGLRRQQLRLEQTLLVVRAVSIDRGYRDREVSHHRRDMAAFVAMWLGTVAAVGGSSAGLPTANTPQRRCALPPSAARSSLGVSGITST